MDLWALAIGEYAAPAFGAPLLAAMQPSAVEAISGEAQLVDVDAGPVGKRSSPRLRLCLSNRWEGGWTKDVYEVIWNCREMPSAHLLVGCCRRLRVAFKATLMQMITEFFPPANKKLMPACVIQVLIWTSNERQNLLWGR
ncbi:uncharacterized protein LOC119364866 [Triticum dicoccoides]|uniref:uncharacterized protein LOC119364866 n=1 Tax=Triticum dicoccoides TaxID=85692 RepID=UPI00188FCB5C|nr:uncharacterized protein LOC119364866 [Triticum dicoccoides]